MMPEPIADPVRFVPAARGRQRDASAHGKRQDALNIVFGFHQHDGLRFHAIDAGINRVSRLCRRIVFDLVFPQQPSQICGDGT